MVETQWILLLFSWVKLVAKQKCRLFLQIISENMLISIFNHVFQIWSYCYSCCSHIIYFALTGEDAKGKNNLKTVICEELGQNQYDPKHSEIVKCDKRDPVTYSDLFSGKTKLFSNNVRTVLMTEAPGIGKTFQTQMFMIDWANNKSNKDKKDVVYLHFTELNTKKFEVKSMKSLQKKN